MSNLQSASWILLNDGKYHYQWNGELFCVNESRHALAEESNPPKRERCMKCVERYNLMIVKELTWYQKLKRFFK